VRGDIPVEEVPGTQSKLEFDLGAQAELFFLLEKRWAKYHKISKMTLAAIIPKYSRRDGEKS